MFKLFKNIKFNQFWLFTILVFTILLVPSLVQKGMFLDGVTYAAISNNLANGIGSVFELHYTKTLMPIFNEHPPLVIWIQALFFKFFGDYFWVEKLFSFLTALLSASAMVLLFNFFFKEKKYNWFLLFIWITIPKVFWAYNNNVLENVLTVFVLYSVYFQLQYFKTKKIYHIIIAALLVVASFLSKGLVGLFPLIVPFLYFLIFEFNYKKIFLNNGLLIILVLVFLQSCLFFFPDLKENLIRYFDAQLIPALQGKREITTTNRFKIIFQLLIELSFPLILLLICLILIKTKKYLYKKESLFFILIGLSGSLPLIISLKQRKFYIVPTIPFFIIGLSLLILPFLVHKFDYLLEKKNTILKVLNSILAVIFIVLVINFDGYFRDKSKVQDIEKIVSEIEKGEIISSTKSLTKDWGTIAYFSRLNYISLTDKSENKYFIKSKQEQLPDFVNKDYSKLNLDLNRFDLYKRK